MAIVLGVEGDSTALLIDVACKRKGYTTKKLPVVGRSACHRKSKKMQDKTFGSPALVYSLRQCLENGQDLPSRGSKTLKPSSVHLAPPGVGDPLVITLMIMMMHKECIRYFSATMFTLFVQSRDTDSDDKGEILIMLWIFVPPCFIPQFILLSNKTPSGKGKCGTNNFDSKCQPQVFWTSSITTTQPTLTYMAHGKKFNALVGTGVDVYY